MCSGSGGSAPAVFRVSAQIFARAPVPKSSRRALMHPKSEYRRKRSDHNRQPCPSDANPYEGTILSPNSWLRCTQWCGSRWSGKAIMDAHALIESASHSPEAVKTMKQAFDDAWQQVAGNFG